jgi:hypothetical protein
MEEKIKMALGIAKGMQARPPYTADQASTEKIIIWSLKKIGNRMPFGVCHGLGGFTHTDSTWNILLGRQFVDRLRRKLILKTKSLATRLRGLMWLE